MNSINLVNECLNYFFVIGDMPIYKPKVKFVVSLASLFFFNTKKVYNQVYIYIYIISYNFGPLTMEEGPFSPRVKKKKFGRVLGLGLSC